MASSGARTAGRRTSPTWRTSAAGSATASTRRRSSRSRSGPSSRIPLSALRSGCPRSGWSPTARTASAPTNWRVRSASPRRPRGSCSRVSGSRCRPSTAGSLSGEVEADETFIGGKARNMHAAKRKRLGISQSRSMIGKVAVMGLLAAPRRERHSKVRTRSHQAIGRSTNLSRCRHRERRSRRRSLHRRAPLLRPDGSSAATSTR